MKSKSTLFLVRGAIIASLYVVLTCFSSLFGLSGGAVQFRLSEALCILPVFFPEAIAGLTLGCLISNIVTGCAVFDIIFGTVATLIGALGAYALRRLPEKIIFIATLPTLISNALIVPFVLIYAYGLDGGYLYFMLTVGLGELVCAVIGGTLLYPVIKKYRKYIT